MADRQLPYSREAEAYVLGSILIEPELAVEFCGRLSTDDFYNDQNKKVYAAIDALYHQKKEVNVINVIEALKTLGTYEAIGEEYLFELTDAVPSIVTTETYVDVLKERTLERELYDETTTISRRVLEGEENISDLLASAEKNILNIVNKQRVENLKPIGVALDDVFDMIDANRKKSVDALIGLDTGFGELNEYTYGFQPGELIILAARPGVGKSAFALNIAQRMATNCNAHVAFFSLEMGIDQLVMRLLSSASNVKLGKIRSGNMNDEETTKLLGGRIALDNLNIYIDETTTNNMEDIKIQCRKLRRENKLDFIIIDYLQLLTASKGKNKMSRYEEVSSLSRSLKLLARELQVPVLALSQLSRAVETRSAEEGKKPILSDLRESGSIEQDADIVLFLHRDSASEDPTRRQSSIKVEVIIAKNRQGMTGSFPLIFRGDCSSFESYQEKKSK